MRVRTVATTATPVRVLGEWMERALAPGPVAPRETSSRLLMTFGAFVMAVGLLFTVRFWLWRDEGGLGYVALAAAIAASAVVCAALARTRRRTSAAIALLAIASVGTFPVAHALSVESDIQLLYLALLLAMLVLVPERLFRTRAAFGAGIVAALIACEFLFLQSDLWAMLDERTANHIAAVNRVVTIVGSAGAVVVLIRRAAREQRLLFGAARVEGRRANTDVLTSLANRRPVLTRFAELDSAGIRDYGIAVIDIDSFKQINDAHGHDAGDRIIVEIGERLSDHFGANALVSRWGGDEFLVLMERIDTVSFVTVLERLRKVVATFPVPVDDVRVPVTLSIGASRALAGVSTDDVVLAADAALYVAKSEGRNRVVFARDDVGATP